MALSASFRHAGSRVVACTCTLPSSASIYALSVGSMSSSRHREVAGAHCSPMQAGWAAYAVPRRLLGLPWPCRRRGSDQKATHCSQLGACFPLAASALRNSVQSRSRLAITHCDFCRYLRTLQPPMFIAEGDTGWEYGSQASTPQSGFNRPDQIFDLEYDVRATCLPVINSHSAAGLRRLLHRRSRTPSALHVVILPLHASALLCSAPHGWRCVVPVRIWV